MRESGTKGAASDGDILAQPRQHQREVIAGIVNEVPKVREAVNRDLRADGDLVKEIEHGVRVWFRRISRVRAQFGAE